MPLGILLVALLLLDLLSVVQTLRKRGAAVLNYLGHALDAHRHRLHAPDLPSAS
jgi:hypothetical protein